jgi:hypothetical protein
MDTNKSQIPANIRQELRSCISVKSLSIIFKSTKMSIRQIHEKMFLLFHGTSEVYAHVDQLLHGKGPYEVLFEKKTILATNSIIDSAVSLVLNKDKLLLDCNYEVGKHIVKSTLESTTFKVGSPLVSGRTLHAQGLRCLKNMKKALAVLMTLPEVDAVTSMGLELKSGISEAEVKVRLLDLMYIELKGKTDVPDEDELETVQTHEDVIDVTDVTTIPREFEVDVTNCVVDLTERPIGWFFNGWFAFCLFGPFAKELDRITLLIATGTKADNSKKNGRLAARDLLKKENDDNRLTDHKHDRGMSLSYKLGIAGLEIKSQDLIIITIDLVVIGISVTMIS